MRKTKLWDALRFRFQKSVNVVPHCFVNLPRPVYSFHDAPVCWCFLLFSHVLTLILCFTLFLTVLTYGKRCFPGGYTSEISLTDLDRSWQILTDSFRGDLLDIALGIGCSMATPSPWWAGRLGTKPRTFRRCALEVAGSWSHWSRWSRNSKKTRRWMNWAVSELHQNLVSWTCFKSPIF